jgi:hypothetical protein
MPKLLPFKYTLCFCTTALHLDLPGRAVITLVTLLPVLDCTYVPTTADAKLRIPVLALNGVLKTYMAVLQEGPMHVQCQT